MGESAGIRPVPAAVSERLSAHALFPGRDLGSEGESWYPCFRNKETGSLGITQV